VEGRAVAVPLNVIEDAKLLRKGRGVEVATEKPKTLVAILIYQSVDRVFHGALLGIPCPDYQYGRAGQGLDSP